MILCTRLYVFLVAIVPVFCVAAVPQRTPVPKDPITFLGSLEYPQSFKGEHKLSILYKGVMYSIDIQKGSKKKAARGYYELYDNQMPRVLHVLVSEDLKLPDDGVIKYLQTSAEHPYRVFRLKQIEYKETSKTPLFTSLAPEGNAPAQLADSVMMMWDIEELPHSEPEWRIPDATIVLFMDPTFIAQLDTAVWDAVRPVVRLPRIVFKKDIAEDIFAQVLNKMQLALMNFKPFHAEPTMKIIPYQNRTVAMPSSLPSSIVAA